MALLGQTNFVFSIVFLTAFAFASFFNLGLFLMVASALFFDLFNF